MILGSWACGWVRKTTVSIKFKYCNGGLSKSVIEYLAGVYNLRLGSRESGKAPHRSDVHDEA